VRAKSEKASAAARRENHVCDGAKKKKIKVVA